MSAMTELGKLWCSEDDGNDQIQKCMVRLVIATINVDNGVGYALMYSESD